MTGSTGRSFLVLRPTLSDIVLKMPRGAQVIYPKDLGAILIAADIGPGQRILEAGVGSGALSMTVLRAGVSVVGYELREDFAERAQANVEATLGPDAPYRIEIRDVTEGIDETDLDRILLDMPEPHKVVVGRGEGPATRRHPAGLPADHQPDRPVAPGARRGRCAVRAGRDARGHAAHLARRSPLGPPGPPHGRPHRIPHHGAPAGRVTMDEGVADYMEALSPQQRPLFDRLHAIVLEEHPEAQVALGYGMPAYRVGRRRLNIGVWKHGVSVYGWRGDNDGGFVARHPTLSSGKGTIRIRPRDAEEISDEELRALLGGALAP